MSTEYVGNNSLESSLADADNNLSTEDQKNSLAATFQQVLAGYTKLPTFEEVNRAYFIAVLGAVGNNKTQAARVLEVDRRTVYRLMERWDIKCKIEYK